jgi:hypothetical protein
MRKLKPQAPVSMLSDKKILTPSATASRITPPIKYRSRFLMFIPPMGQTYAGREGDMNTVMPLSCSETRK